MVFVEDGTYLENTTWYSSPPFLSYIHVISGWDFRNLNILSTQKIFSEQYIKNVKQNAMY